MIIKKKIRHLCTYSSEMSLWSGDTDPVMWLNIVNFKPPYQVDLEIVDIKSSHLDNKTY